MKKINVRNKKTNGQKKILLRLNIFLLFIFPTFFVACSSAPYSTKSMKENVLLTKEDVLKKYNINESWWKIYQDEKLNALVQQALDNNIDLKKAAINVKQALYSAKLAGADLIPTFSASATASVNKDFYNNTKAVSSYSGQIGLSYEIDLWQKMTATANAQKWEYQATEQDWATVKLTLVNNVIDAYFQLSYLDEAIQLAEENMKQYKKLAEIAQTKYEYGKVSAIESVQAKQSMLSAENSLEQLKNTQVTTLQTLRNLLNLRPGDNFTIEPTPLDKLPNTKIDLDVPLSVLANRPDLMAAEMRLQSSFSSLRAQKRSWYPTISLNLGLSQSSQKLGEIFRLPIGAASVSINLPFLQWQTLLWQNKKAKQTFESAKLDFEKSLTTALNEVAGYYFQYSFAQKNLSRTQEKFFMDEQNANYYKNRYEYGKNEFADYLNALSTLQSTEQTLLNNRYEMRKYENMVYKSMAGKYDVKEADENVSQEVKSVDTE